MKYDLPVFSVRRQDTHLQSATKRKNKLIHVGDYYELVRNQYVCGQNCIKPTSIFAFKYNSIFADYSRVRWRTIN